MGVQVPALNTAGACAGFIGVLPELRGNGFAYGLLAECTTSAPPRGPRTSPPATDQHAVPMAAAFTRAGCPVVQERIDLVRRTATPPGRCGPGRAACSRG